ncbi:MAG: hypothetical protein GXP55_12125 [Deltaproteobacteria bacterium]|nr:hypothetical protein [Deltaproteobacteria bacterium]
MRVLLSSLCLLLLSSNVLAQEANDAAPRDVEATRDPGGQSTDAMAPEAAADGVAEDEDEAESDDAVAPAPDLDAQARRLFVAGRDAYQEGRFEEAAALWERAFDLSGRATLLLGLGDAYDRLRQGRRAANVLRQYLVLEPETDSREHLEARIDLLLHDDSGPAPRRRTITYVLAASAGVSALVSGFYWARARSRYDALAATCGGTPGGCAQGQIGSVRSAQRVSRVALGISLSVAVAAVVSYFLEGRPREAERQRARRRARRHAL